MKHIRIIVIAVGSLMFAAAGSGCKTPCPAAQTAISDSVVIEKTVYYTDTVFKTEPSQVYHIVSVDSFCTVIPVKKTYGNATLSLSKEGNTLKAKCFCDTIAIKAKLKTTLEKQHRQNTTTNTTTKEIKYIPFLVEVLAWIGGLSLLYFAILLGFKIFKP